MLWHWMTIMIDMIRRNSLVLLATSGSGQETGKHLETELHLPENGRSHTFPCAWIISATESIGLSFLSIFRCANKYLNWISVADSCAFPLTTSSSAFYWLNRSLNSNFQRALLFFFALYLFSVFLPGSVFVSSILFSSSFLKQYEVLVCCLFTAGAHHSLAILSVGEQKLMKSTNRSRSHQLNALTSHKLIAINRSISDGTQLHIRHEQHTTETERTKKNIIIVKTFVSVSMNIDAFSHIFFVSMLFLVAASLHFHFYIYHNTKAKTATDYFAHIFFPLRFRFSICCCHEIQLNFNHGSFELFCCAA